MKPEDKNKLKQMVNSLHLAVTNDDKQEALHIIEDDIVPMIGRKPGRQKGSKHPRKNVTVSEESA